MVAICTLLKRGDRTAFISAVVTIACLFFTSSVVAIESSKPDKTKTLFLFGGATSPDLAIQKFVQAAGGIQGRILFIAWATDKPHDYYEAFKSRTRTDAEKTEGPEVILAPEYETLLSEDFIQGSAAHDELSEKLSESSAIFFSGGDQNRVMDVLKKHEWLHKKILHLYDGGKPMGGKSAGTAIASEVMITGGDNQRTIDPETVGIGAGLGFLRGLVVDQHFREKNRDRRLLSAMLKANINLSIGVDGDNAVIIHNDRLLEPIGPGDLSIFRMVNAGLKQFREYVVREGKFFDLTLLSTFSRSNDGQLVQVEPPASIGGM